MSTLLVAILALVGCGPKENPYGFAGTGMAEFFPFDGEERSWIFVNDDEGYSFKLHASTQPDLLEEKGNDRIYTVSYAAQCANDDPDCEEEEELFQIRWMSSKGDGVFIYGYTIGEEVVDFRPPIQLLEKDGFRDTTVKTKTGGVTWSAHLIQWEQCPVKMNVDWDECAHIRLEQDGEGDGYPLQGDWWSIVQYNVVAFDLDGEEGMWQLTSSECEPRVSCDGSW